MTNIRYKLGIFSKTRLPCMNAWWQPYNWEQATWLLCLVLLILGWTRQAPPLFKHFFIYASRGPHSGCQNYLYKSVPVSLLEWSTQWKDHLEDGQFTPWGPAKPAKILPGIWRRLIRESWYALHRNGFKFHQREKSEKTPFLVFSRRFVKIGKDE